MEMVFKARGLDSSTSEWYVLPKRKEIWRLGEDQRRGHLGGRACRGAGKALSWTPVKEACEPRLSRVRVGCGSAQCVLGRHSALPKRAAEGCVCARVVTADPGSGKGENKGDVGLGTVK